MRIAYTTADPETRTGTRPCSQADHGTTGIGCVALRVNGGSLRWFADGADKWGSTGAEVVVNTTSDLRMGDTEHNTHFIQAHFDEVRIANVFRSDDWIKASLITKRVLAHAWSVTEASQVHG